MQAQLLFLQANAKTGTTSTKPKKLFVKKNFANIPEITMQDLEQMQTDDVLAYVSEVNNIKMPQENISALLPALAAFDSHTKLSSNSDDDDNDIANAYAMEYASSDDEKAWRSRSSNNIELAVNKQIPFYTTLSIFSINNKSNTIKPIPDKLTDIIIDGAASENLTGNASILIDSKHDPQPITIATAGSEKLKSTRIGRFPLKLPSYATKARYVQGMSANLLSVPQLTTHNFNFTLKTDATS